MTAGLFASASGIRANQAGLNVASNNVANLNTIAFKSSKANFHTVFAGTINGGNGPQSDIGGVNPIQIGNGTQLADVSVNFGQGGQNFTSKQTDLMIAGNGFFTIEVVDANGNSDSKMTRAGNFEKDSNGYLVYATGNRLLGTSTIEGNNTASVSPIRIPEKMRVYKTVTTATGVVTAAVIGNTTTTAPVAGAGQTVSTEDVVQTSYAIGSDGAISISYSNGDRVTVQNQPPLNTLKELKLYTTQGYDFSSSGLGTGIDGVLGNPDTVLLPEEIQIRIANVVNPKGLIQEGSSMYSLGANSGSVTMGIANRGGRGAIQSSVLETSNVDLGNEFTQIILLQRGVEASSRTLRAQSETLQSIINII